MINGKRIIVVVPARGGSKGIPLKNLRTVQGVPLVAQVGHVIARMPKIDRAVVSTDHEEIAAVAKSTGIAAPFRRPPELSGDSIGDLEVLTHALLTCEVMDAVKYDIVVMLQPTSPMREPNHVMETIRMLIEGHWDAVWTVSETDSKAHPFKQLTIYKSSLEYHDPRGNEIIARQQLAPVYHRNGIAYAITRDCLVNQKSISGNHTGALVIKGQHVSIDTEWDLQLVEYILSMPKKI
jgi:CMP-N,N'-diacetyllegionaminic acid synthase